MKKDEAKKEDANGQGCWSASRASPGSSCPHWAASRTARVGLHTKEQDEFYEPYLLGPKAKREEEERKIINNLLTV